MRKLIFLLSALLFSATLFAQTGNLRGFVYEKESGEPVMFCNVFLKGTTIGAPTDINGMYNISKVKSGNYQLVVTYLGYDTTQVEINLGNNQLLTKNLEIAESSIKLNEVKIGNSSKLEIFIDLSILLKSISFSSSPNAILFFKL